MRSEIAAPAERFGRLILSCFSWLALFYLALPLFIIISVSFTETQYLKFPPEGFTLAWYWQFLRDPSYLWAIWISAVIAIGATAIALLLGVPAALAIARAEFPGRRALVAMFLSPLILPTIVLGAAVLQYSAALGYARTLWAILLGHAALVIPYVVRATIAALARFDLSLEEAARDLGASAVETFFRVTLPLIRPGIIAGAIFAVIISWINVELSIFNTTAAVMTIPVKLFNYIQYNVDPMIAAVSATTIYVAIFVVVALDLLVGIDRATTSSN